MIDLAALTLVSVSSRYYFLQAYTRHALMYVSWSSLIAVLFDDL